MVGHYPVSSQRTLVAPGTAHQTNSLAHSSIPEIPHIQIESSCRVSVCFEKLRSLKRVVDVLELNWLF